MSFLPDAYDALAVDSGAVGDVYRDILEHPPYPGETPRQTDYRTAREAGATARIQVMKGKQLAARGTPSYTDQQGNTQPVVDDTGSPLNKLDPRHDIAYDSAGEPKKIEFDDAGSPVLKDPFEGLQVKTDKTGEQYQIAPGLPWRWVGTDKRVKQKAEFAREDALLSKASTTLGRKITLTEHDALLQTRAMKDAHGQLKQLGVDSTDPLTGEPLEYDALVGGIHARYDDLKKNDKLANAKSYFGLGDYTPEALQAQRDLDVQRTAALRAAATGHAHAQSLAQIRASAEAARAQRMEIERRKLDHETALLQAQGIDISQPQDGGEVPMPASYAGDEGSIPSPATQPEQAASAPTPIATDEVVEREADTRSTWDYWTGKLGAAVDSYQSMNWNILALGAKLIGADEQARKFAQWGRFNEDESQKFKIRGAGKIEDIHGAGDFAYWLGNTVVDLAPQIAETITAAVGGAVVGGASAGPAGAGGGFLAGIFGKQAIKALVKAETKNLVAGGMEKSVAKEAAELVVRNGIKTAAGKEVLTEAIKAQGRKAGAFLGAFASSYKANAGEIYGNLLADPAVPEGKAEMATMLFAVPTAALDSIVPGGVVNKMFGGAVNKASRETAKKFATRIASELGYSIGTEAGTEGAQSLLGFAAKRWAKDQWEPLTDQEKSEFWNSAAAGAAGGGVFGGVSVLAEGRFGTNPPAAGSEETPEIEPPPDGTPLTPEPPAEPPEGEVPPEPAPAPPGALPPEAPPEAPPEEPPGFIPSDENASEIGKTNIGDVLDQVVTSEPATSSQPPVPVEAPLLIEPPAAPPPEPVAPAAAKPVETPAERIDRELHEERVAYRKEVATRPIAQQPPRMWYEREAAETRGIGPSELTFEDIANYKKMWQNARDAAVAQGKPVYASASDDTPPKKGWTREGELWMPPVKAEAAPKPQKPSPVKHGEFPQSGYTAHPPDKPAQPAAAPAAEQPAPAPVAGLPKPTAADFRNRYKDPGVDYAAAPNSIIIQVRGLDTHPLGDGKPIVLPFDGDLAHAGATVDSGMTRTIESKGGSFRESVIVVTDANGKATHYLKYNPAERKVEAATVKDIAALREYYRTGKQPESATAREMAGLPAPAAAPAPAEPQAKAVSSISPKPVIPAPKSADAIAAERKAQQGRNQLPLMSISEPATAPVSAHGIRSEVEGGIPHGPVKISEIASRPDLMQFKRTDESDGTNITERINAETYDTLKEGRPLLWEPANPEQHGLAPGEKYIVADGHHRLEFARRTGQSQFEDAQILREADGYSANDARTLAAERNIVDGRGTIHDRAKFLRNSAATHGTDEAVARARRLGFGGRQEATIAFAASDPVFDAFVNDRISPGEAAAIAKAAPKNEEAQQFGLRALADGKSIEFAENRVRAQLARPEGTPKQIDLFGKEVFAEQDAQADRATEIMAGIRRDIADLRDRRKNPARARELVENLDDPEAVKAGIAQMQAELSRWENWPMHADLVARTRPAPPVEAEPKLRPGEKATGELFQGEDQPFNLAGEQTIDADRIVREKAAKDAAAAEARAQAERDQQPLFPAAEPKPEVPFGSKNKIVSAERAEELRKRIRGKLGGTYVGLDPTIFSDAVQLGAYYIEGGFHKFADWSAKMLADFGDAISNQLRSIYETARITIESPGGESRSGQPTGIQPGLNPPTERIVTARAEHTKRADESIIPSELLPHLDPHQRQGAATAIRSMEDRGGTLNADGTGAGKTRQALTVAHYFAKKGFSVVIVTKAETIKPDWKKNTFGGSYGFDSKAMGVPVSLARDGNVKAGGIGITTYENLADVDRHAGTGTVLIFDESHALKNQSQRSKFGLRAIAKAKSVMFMSATPADKPEHIAYLARMGIMEGKTVQRQLSDLGMKLVTVPKRDKDGRRYDVTFWTEDQTVSDTERNARFSALFNRMTANGAMIKREISMDGVHVQVLRLALPPEAHDTMESILQFFDASSVDDLQGLQKAVVLGHQRRQQEPFKIASTVMLAQRELAAGRQVVIFVSRVNASEVGKWVKEGGAFGGESERVREVLMSSEGTAKTMREAMEDAGIHDIAEIHGNADQNSLEAMADFQAGRKRVVIATIESGGTGINLDDTAGNRPRSMIIVTAPFDAVGNVQAAGRIWRLKTLSRANLFYLFGDTDVDAWNADIIGSKMSTLGAVVEGQVRRLDISDTEQVSTDQYHEKVKQEPKAEDASPTALPALDWKPFKTKAGADKFVAPATPEFWKWWKANGDRNNSAGVRVSKWQDQWQVWSDKSPSELGKTGSPLSIATAAPARGLSKAAANRAVAKLSAISPVTVVADWSEAPPAAREAIAARGIADPNRVRGMVLGGKVYLNAAAHGTVAEARMTWFHEVGSHLGVDPLLEGASPGSTKRLDAVLRLHFPKEYKAAKKDYTAGEQVSETLAKVMELLGPSMSAQKRTAWNRIVDYVRTVLAKLGLKEWSREDVEALLRRGLDRVRKGAPAREQASPGRITFANAVLKAPGAPPIRADLSLTAHHGTPHEVDRFSTEKVGTGEGAQVYGWGLYFAENEKVAEDYRKNLSEPKHIYKGKPYLRTSDLNEAWLKDGMTPDDIAALWRKIHYGDTPQYLAETWDLYPNREKDFEKPSSVRRVVERMDTPDMSAKQGERLLKPVDGSSGLRRMTPEEKSAFYDLSGSFHWKRNKPDPLAELASEQRRIIAAQTENLASRVEEDGIFGRKEATRWLEMAKAKLALIEGGKVQVVTQQAHGNTYTVHLDVEPGELLDLDMPMGEQSPEVLAKLEAAGHDRALLRGEGGAHTWYNKLASGGPINLDSPWNPKKASEYLNSIGIPGIRYRDQGTRFAVPQKNYHIAPENHGTTFVVRRGVAGEVLGTYPSYEQAEAWVLSQPDASQPTYNYVIFDESKIRITHRNGDPVAAAERTAMLEGAKESAAKFSIKSESEGKVAEGPTPDIQNIVPAIRVGDEVIRGRKGDTHQAIMDRLKAEDFDKWAGALADFDSKANPNFFVDTAGGGELSRTELNGHFGVTDSQGLHDAQRKVAEERAALSAQTPTGNENENRPTQGAPENQPAEVRHGPAVDTGRFLAGDAEGIGGRDADSAFARRVGRILSAKSRAWESAGIASRERTARDEVGGAAWLDTATHTIVHDTAELIRGARLVEEDGGSAADYIRSVLGEEESHWRDVAAARQAGDKSGKTQLRAWEEAPEPVQSALTGLYRSAENDAHRGAELIRMLHQLLTEGKITEETIQIRNTGPMLDALNAWDIPKWLVDHLTAMESVKVEARGLEGTDLPRRLLSATPESRATEAAEAGPKGRPETPADRKAARAATMGVKPAGVAQSIWDAITGVGGAVKKWHGELAAYDSIDQAIGQWLGAGDSKPVKGTDIVVPGRQKAAHESRALTEAIVKQFPNLLTRQAISRYMEAAGDETQLREWADAAKPPLKPVYERALNLNDAEKAMADTATKFFAEKGAEAQELGLLGNLLENYVTHFVEQAPASKRAGLMARILGDLASDTPASKLRTKFDHAIKRVFKSMFDLEQEGYSLRGGGDIAGTIGAYAQAANNTVADRIFVKSLTGIKARDGRPMAVPSGAITRTDAPVADSPLLIKPSAQPPDSSDYRPIPHPALRKWKWIGKEGDKDVMVEGELLIHPDLYKRLKNTLGTSALNNVPIIKAIGEFQGVVKQLMLSFSAFHYVQEGTHAIGHKVNPFQIGEIDMDDPMTRELVNAGLMLANWNARAEFGEGLTASGMENLLGRVGLGKLGKLNDDLSAFLFERYIPGLKVVMAKAALERNLKRYDRDLAAGKITRAQVAQRTAQQANDAFGEQNNLYAGNNPTRLHAERLLFLAPDFLKSRAKFFADAFRKHGGEQAHAILLLSVILAVTAKLLERMLTGKNDWEKPFSVVDGTRQYELRSVPGDVLHLLSNTRQFVMGRISPLISRTTLEAATGRDWRGSKRTAGEQMKDLALTPLPISVRALVDPEAPDISALESVGGAMGLRTVRHSDITKARILGHEWQKAQGTEHPDEVYPPSKYRGLKNALEDGDAGRAMKEYGKLLATMPKEKVDLGFHQSLMKPFSGSAANEKAFAASLTGWDRETYHAAMTQRGRMLAAFRRMSATTRAPAGAPKAKPAAGRALTAREFFR